MYIMASNMTYLSDYTPPAFWITRVELTFELGATNTYVTAQLHCKRNPSASDNAPLELIGEGLTCLSVSLNHVTLAENQYEVSPDYLRIENVSEVCVVEVKTLIHPNKNTALEGLYESRSGLFTQCESQGFRRITYYLDRPDVMAEFRTKLIAKQSQYPVLLSNGNLVEQGAGADGTHWTLWHDPFKKPSYLFALVAGDLMEVRDHYITASQKKVDLKMYVALRDKNKAQHALHALKRSMHWDEKNYGREYDLNLYMIVAVDDFNMGAMENKGLNIFNTECVLANEETSTDKDYEWVETVVGHEYFHNWTGNRITCREWFQLCLKEGLTVFREQSFMAHMTTPGLMRIEQANLLRARQFAEDQGPLSHPVRPTAYQEINNFYTLTVYHKGAEIYRMLHNLLGEKMFRACMDAYFERYDGQAVTMEDLIHCFESVSGQDLEQFALWYQQAGTPKVTVKGDYDSDQKTWTLTLKQTCLGPHASKHKPFCIPFAIGLLDKTGKALALNLETDDKPSHLKTRVLSFTDTTQQFTFTKIGSTPIPSYLRHFSSPVELETDLSFDDLLFLFKHDTDDFNRWDAGQRVLSKTILEGIAKNNAPAPDSLPAALFTAIDTILSHENLHPGMASACISLPSEAYLAQQMTEIDVEGIAKWHQALQQLIGQKLKHSFLNTYEKMSEMTTDTQQNRAKRRLKNRCLAYLVASGEGEYISLAMQQFETASNMTDKLAALTALSHTQTAEAQAAVEAFYNTWQEEPLVINKWLRVQAASKCPGTLARVKQLMTHPAFNLHNPNKVRALIGTFCEGNMAQFHAINGEGYDFLMTQIAHLDGLNPQLASRLLNPFSTWQRFDTTRQNLMREKLSELATKTSAKDTQEILSKLLDI